MLSGSPFGILEAVKAKARDGAFSGRLIHHSVQPYTWGYTPAPFELANTVRAVGRYEHPPNERSDEPRTGLASPRVRDSIQLAEALLFHAGSAGGQWSICGLRTRQPSAVRQKG